VTHGSPKLDYAADLDRRAAAAAEVDRALRAAARSHEHAKIAVGIAFLFFGIAAILAATVFLLVLRSA
jgi:hypothetical protein